MNDIVRTGPGLEIKRELEPIGVIDIGSNSVRLVVYEGAVRAPVPVFNEKVMCGLGRDVGSTGNLGREATERAVAALKRFGAVARLLQVKNLRAIATAAVRDARDGPAFIKRGEAACGCSIQILTGEREAQLAAAGIAMGFLDPDGIAGDLGGGSLELIDIEKSGTVRHAVSLPLGGLRLFDAAGGKFDTATKLASRSLDTVGWMPKGSGRPFYAVGGTWRALAKLHMAQTNYPLRVMHGYEISTAEALALCQTVQKEKSFKAMHAYSTVSKSRREMLPMGAMVLEQVVRRLKPSKIVFSVYGIREGLLYSLLSPTERARDPLLSFCEDYAYLRARSLTHAKELCAWSDPLFQPPGPSENDSLRRLRYAACLLSDIGWRAHPDYRGEQSLNVIAHAGLAGIDHPGRIFIALTVYFRHVGVGKPDETGADFSEQLKTIIDKDLIDRARLLGAVFRAAHMLSIGRAGVIDEAPVGYDGNKLVLTLPKTYRDMQGERLERRFSALASLLGRSFELRID